MKVGYTEFSYGYAFTENLMRSRTTSSSGAPVFPNLVQEAKLGYDVKISQPAAPLFIQFKLPERMTKSTAFEIAGGRCPGLTIPFFRIAIMRSNASRQHEHLIALEKTNPGCVYYAAPELGSIGSFNASYDLGHVSADSAFFSPIQIGPLPDSMQHTIAYKPNLNHAYFCSVPQERPKNTFDGVMSKISHAFIDEHNATLVEVATRVRRDVLQCASVPSRQRSAGLADRILVRLRNAATDGSLDDEKAGVLTNLLVAREVARVDLGIELLIAQPG